MKIKNVTVAGTGVLGSQIASQTAFENPDFLKAEYQQEPQFQS